MKHNNRCLIVIQRLGLPSQTWIRRQAEAISKFAPTVLTWQIVGDREPISLPVILVDEDPEPYAGRGRWWFRARHLADWNFFGTLGREAVRLEEALKTIQPSVMLCHFGHMGLRLLPIAEKLGIPIVVHFHGMDLGPMLRKWFYRTSLSHCFSRFNAAIVVGRFQQEVLEQLGCDLDRTHLLPCGVPTQLFRPGNSVHDGPLRLVTTTRLVPEKGNREIIHAFARAFGGADVAGLTIIGEGPEQAALRALAGELRVANKVRFTGALTEREVIRELQRSDIYVQHSYDEGFGVALAEAASTGLPIVATRVGGIPDQVCDQETGILTAPGDVASFATAMARLGADPATRQQMGLAGRQRMIEHFDIQKQVTQLEEILGRAVHRGRSPTCSLSGANTA